MNTDIEKMDKISILFRTGIKAVRGCFKRLFLKEAHGVLLVGKGVQITHTQERVPEACWHLPFCYDCLRTRNQNRICFP